MSGRVLLFDPSDYPAMISEWTDQRVLEPGTYIWPGLIKGANMAYGGPSWTGSGASIQCSEAVRRFPATTAMLRHAHVLPPLSALHAELSLSPSRTQSPHD